MCTSMSAYAFFIQSVSLLFFDLLSRRGEFPFPLDMNSHRTQGWELVLHLSFHANGDDKPDA